jgi:1,4-dihydroxy-2-naphthoate octaprenyltransferase
LCKFWNDENLVDAMSILIGRLWEWLILVVLPIVAQVQKYFWPKEVPMSTLPGVAVVFRVQHSMFARRHSCSTYSPGWPIH